MTKKKNDIYVLGDNSPKGSLVAKEVLTKKFVFPEGDPRNDMTPEELKAIGEQEDKKLFSHIDKFAINNPQQDALSNNAVEEETEEEVYNVDLSVAQVKKLTPDVIEIVENKTFTGNVEGVIQADPYMKIISHYFVRKACRKVINEIEKSVDDLEEALRSLPWKLREPVQKEIDDLRDRAYQLQRIIGYGSSSKGIVVPEWAEADVEDRVRNMVSSLVDLTD
jgi:hypothetical protein